MSEMGDDFIEKGSNVEGNVYVDPRMKLPLYILRSSGLVLVISLEEEFFKTSLLVPVLCPLWVDLFFTELVALRMLYLCS